MEEKVVRTDRPGPAQKADSTPTSRAGGTVLVSGPLEDHTIRDFREVCSAEAAGAVVCAAARTAVCTGGTPSAGGSPLCGEGPSRQLAGAPRLERRHTPTNALVGLRQEIMRPDGCLPSTSLIRACDATTVAATCVRQSSHRLSADGIVGPATYSTASRRLVDVPPWTVYRRTMSESGCCS